MTRTALGALIEELQGLARLEDHAAYRRGRDGLLARAVPALARTRRTRYLADMLRSALRGGRHVPPPGDAEPEEYEEASRKARAEAREDIARLLPPLRRALRMDRALLLVGGLFLAAGALGIWFAGGQLRDAGASAGWPVTDGRLISLEIQRRANSTYNGRQGTRNETVTWRLAAVYTYRVDGRDYLGNRVSFEAGTRDRDYWETKARRYRTGMAVPVHYDPAAPDRSVLEPGTHVDNWLFLCVALGLAGAGGWLTMRELRFRFG